jgi:two-component system response regulator RegA
MGIGGIGSVLVIDDDKCWCEEMAHQFRREGIKRVGGATGAAEALALLHAEGADLTTVDLCLDRGGLESGFELIPQIKKHSPGTRVVVVTDYWSVSTCQLALHLGADAFTGKPTTAPAVLALAEGKGALARPKLRYAPLELIEREHIMRTLLSCGGNVTLTARLLEIDRRSLQRKIKKGIPRP